MKSGIDQEIAPGSLTSEVGYRAWLYDVDGEDTPVKVDDANLLELSDKQVLWIDVDLNAAGNLDRLWDNLGLNEEARGPAATGERPHLVRQEHFIQLNVFAVRDVDESDFQPVALQCLVGKNWIATLHKGKLDLPDRFNEPLVGETRLGELDGPAFLSMVLEWQLNGYYRVIEELQAEIDRLDEELLKPSPNKPALLDRMLVMRRRVTKLRTTLSSHRDVFSLLSHPQSEALLGSEAASDFERLSQRLERALDSVDTAREMIVGSFDIFMTQTSQATNEIMKRLTLVSVLLLPAVVIAGIMGMNFKISLFDKPWMFGVTLAIMALLASVTMIVARRRRWI